MDGYDELQTGAVVFDLSSHTKLKVSGPERASFLDNLLTNDVKNLGKGGSCLALLLDRFGKIRFSMMVYDFGGYFILVTSDENRSSFLDAIRTASELTEAIVKDVSEIFGLITLQGPESEDIATSLTIEPRFPSFRTGAKGIDAFVSVSDKERILNSVQLGSQGLFEIARIEGGILGADISSDVLAFENGLNNAIDYKKGCFIGQEIVSRMKNLGGKAPYRFEGFTCDEEVRVGQDVLESGVRVGIVTSSCLSSRFGKYLLITRIKNKEYHSLFAGGQNLTFVSLKGLL